MRGNNFKKSDIPKIKQNHKKLASKLKKMSLQELEVTLPKKLRDWFSKNSKIMIEYDYSGQHLEKND